MNEEKPVEKEIFHRVQVNPTPSSIVEANAELCSPQNLSVHPVSMKVAEALAKNANDISHIPGVTQLFMDLATVLLSRRSADPEQLLEDYLTSKYLPVLQTLPHHRCGSVSATERASDVSSMPEEETENTELPVEVRRYIAHPEVKTGEGTSLEERLSASGTTAMHRAVLQRVARLALTSRPDDVEGFLLTRWEKEALRADDTISVEACPAPPPEDTAHRLENLVPCGCLNGRVVVRHAVGMLLAAKPENPINFLADFYSSRLRLLDDGTLSRLDTTMTDNNVQGSSFGAGLGAFRRTSQDNCPAKNVAPQHSRRSSGRVSPRNRGPSIGSSAVPLSTALEFMRRSEQRWLAGGGSPAALSSGNAGSLHGSTSSRRKEDMPASSGLGQRSGGFSPVQQFSGLTTPIIATGGPSGILPPSRGYHEDPLLEVKNSRPRSPPPPTTLTEVAEGSSRDHYQRSAKQRFAGSVIREGSGVKCARFSMPSGTIPGGNRDEWLMGLRGACSNDSRRYLVKAVGQEFKEDLEEDVEDEGEPARNMGMDEDDDIDLDVSGKAASFSRTSHYPAGYSAAVATLRRDLSVFQAKREFRLELAREEVNALKLEKNYREMVARKRPTEEALLALENVSEALQEAESFLEESEAHYVASLRSLSRWVRCS